MGVTSTTIFLINACRSRPAAILLGLSAVACGPLAWALQRVAPIDGGSGATQTLALQALLVLAASWASRTLGELNLMARTLGSAHRMGIRFIPIAVAVVVTATLGISSSAAFGVHVPASILFWTAAKVSWLGALTLMISPRGHVAVALPFAVWAATLSPWAPIHESLGLTATRWQTHQALYLLALGLLVLAWDQRATRYPSSSGS